MNIELLQKVKAHILAEPRRMNMDHWTRTSAEILQRNPATKVDNLPPCGTEACIAGWAKHLARDASQAQRWGRPAGEYLDIDCGQGARLFYADRWPETFKTRLGSYDPRTAEYAKVVADRIDHFIRTKGAE